MRSSLGIVVVLAVITVLHAQTNSNEWYRAVSSDKPGDVQSSLRITTISGNVVLAPKLPEQVGFGLPTISPDTSTVGWLAYFPNPSSRDPLPMELVLYRNHRIFRHYETGQAIFSWRFVGNKQVAYATGPLHGSGGEDYLKNTKTGRIVASWSEPDADVTPDGNKPVRPSWAAGLTN